MQNNRNRQELKIEISLRGIKQSYTIFGLTGAILGLMALVLPFPEFRYKNAENVIISAGLHMFFTGTNNLLQEEIDVLKVNFSERLNLFYLLVLVSDRCHLFQSPIYKNPLWLAFGAGTVLYTGYLRYAAPKHRGVAEKSVFCMSKRKVFASVSTAIFLFSWWLRPDSSVPGGEKFFHIITRLLFISLNFYFSSDMPAEKKRGSMLISTIYSVGAFAAFWNQNPMLDDLITKLGAGLAIHMRLQRMGF